MQNPQFPWIDETAVPSGLQMTDTRNGQAAVVHSDAERAAFLADHSSAAGPGLGDRVHATLDWAGFHRCQSCAERQARLNAVSNWWQGGR